MTRLILVHVKNRKAKKTADLMRALLGSAIPLRPQVQGSPSLANPFSGTTVHWTVAEIRLTPGAPPAGALRASNLHPQLRIRHVHVPLFAPGEIVQYRANGSIFL
ncbi:MAG: hypothetical protein BMS9Abin22_109 [Gammaproteobacteria bacterium]|nr:MAG: hypothetical protein BMS9Abin22_109 [Gammaproteobacteria bacterium]